MKKNMHTNSLEAFKKIDPSTRHYAVLMVYVKHHPHALTDREVMFELDFDDMNNVRPRITELKQEGLIVETDKKRIDSVTGHTVSEKMFNINYSSESKECITKPMNGAKPMKCKYCGLITYFILNGKGFCTAGSSCKGPKYSKPEIVNVQKIMELI